MSSSPPAVAVPQPRWNLAAKFRFQTAVVLYLAWLIYLAWQVAITRIPHGPPPVLSRTQWAVAEAELIGTPLGGDRFQVSEVFFGPADLGLKKGEMKIEGLDQARRMPVDRHEEWLNHEWLVPVVRRGAAWAVAPLPPTPGFRARQIGAEAGQVYWYTERLRIHSRAVRKEVFGEKE